MSVAQGSTRFADMPFKQTKLIFRSRHDKSSFSNGRKLINGLDILQSVEFGITKNKSSDRNCGGWEKESRIAVFLTSCFHWEKNAGECFSGDSWKLLNGSGQSTERLQRSFISFSFSAVTAKPPQCSFNHINYNVGEIWNPFLLPKGYYRCKRCICKLVSASYCVWVNCASSIVTLRKFCSVQNW